MRNLVFFWTLLLGGTFLLVGCGDRTPPTTSGDATEQSAQLSEAEPEQPAEQPKDIVDTAAAAEDFKTLVAAVKAAGLVETLKGEGPFTVFAPTDAAFGKLPAGTLDELLKPESKEKLTSILTYHVVPGKVLAADVVKLKTAKTAQGAEVAIAVEGGKVKVDGANVTATDIECSNGVIHVIDAVNTTQIVGRRVPAVSPGVGTCLLPPAGPLSRRIGNPPTLVGRFRRRRRPRETSRSTH